MPCRPVYGRVNPDYVGTEITQEHGGVRTRIATGKIEHYYSTERQHDSPPYLSRCAYNKLLPTATQHYPYSQMWSSVTSMKVYTYRQTAAMR